MPSETPALVYAPGIDGTGRLLFRQQRLHDDYDVHCVAYPQDRTHTYADLAALVEGELYRAGPATLLAESFGGAVALMAALARPELVQRLVLVNTFAHYPRHFYIRLAAAVGPWLPAWPSSLLRTTRGGLFLSPDVSWEVRRRWFELTADVPLSAFGRRFALIADVDLRARLTELAMPTLVLAAPDDHVVPPVAGRLLARQIKGATLVEPRTSHAALVHPAVDVAELLARYFGPSPNRCN
jgi:pimeloyl-ACP methyl ester carboxylesterase